MTSVRGILLAGLIAIAVTGAHATYRAWPVTHGTEIGVPAALFRQPVSIGVVQVRLPMAQIALDVPHTGPAVTEPFVPVRKIGGWWITGGDLHANSRVLRGRRLYLQLRPGEPVMPGGPVQALPFSVSDAPITDAINLAGTVSRVREDGYLWLDFSIGWIGVPPAVESGARLIDMGGAPRNPAAGPAPPAADPDVFAILRVLPSGRATLVAVVVKGARY